LLYGQFRKAIQYLWFKGYKVEYYEGPGWVSRDFVVRGDTAAIRHLEKVVMRWVG
jgi:hypothetical protein